MKPISVILIEILTYVLQLAIFYGVFWVGRFFYKYYKKNLKD